MSVHKTGLIPLLICERLYVEMGDENSQGSVFKTVTSRIYRYHLKINNC